MNSGTPRRCRDCGLELPAGAPAGQCPNCLLALALTPEPDPATSPGSESVPLRPKRILGEYELLEEIAHGGMGVVWKARQLGLNRIVALKTLHAGNLASASARLRFRIEVEAVARLDHPHIISLLESGECEGTHYYTMNYVEGGNLADLLADSRRRPGLRGLMELMVKVARAVDYAHQRGLLHRDLKPSNLLIETSGEPLVADFGLARPLYFDSDLTVSGAVLGSPHYMAPEQTRGAASELSVAADVYALGAVLYEMISGRPPFVAATPLEVIEQARQVEPPPPSMVPGSAKLPNRSAQRDLDTLVLKCLQKSPGARYRSAAALADELQRWLDGRPIEARPVGSLEKAWRWCRREPALAASALSVAILLLAVATGAVVHSRRMGQAGRQIAAQAAQLREQNTSLRLREVEAHFNQGESAQALATLAGMVRDNPSNSVATARLQSALQLRSFASPVGYPLAHPVSVALAGWCGTSNVLSTLAVDGHSRLWDTVHGQLLKEELIVPAGSGLTAFAANGQVWAITRGATVFAGQVTDPSARFQFDHSNRVAQLRLDPLGVRLATADDRGRCRVWELGSMGGAGPWVDVGAPVLGLEPLSQDPTLLFVATSDGRLGCYESSNGRWRWQRQIGVTPPPNFALSRDGERLGVAAAGTVGWWDARTGKTLCEWPLPLGRGERLLFDAAGGRLAVVSTGPTGEHVLVWNLSDGSAQPVVLRHRDRIASVEFSADGRRILTASFDRTVRLWSADDGIPVGEPCLHPGGVFFARFSPDERWVVSLPFTGGAWVWRVPEPRKIPTLEHGVAVTAAAFDTSGQQIATGDAAGRIRIWNGTVQPPTLFEPQPLTRIWEVNFSPDGQQWVCAGSAGVAFLGNTREGSVRRLAHGTWTWVMSASFSPDGRYVVTASHDRTARIWETREGRELFVLAHPAAVNEARFSPDGRWVLTRAEDERARLWETATGRLLSDKLRQESWVDAIGFSLEGSRILTASRDNTLRVWSSRDWDQGGEVTPMEYRAPSGIFRAHMSADGRRFLAGLNGQMTALWAVGQLEPYRLLTHEGAVLEVGFDPAGRRVVTASGDGVARVWDAATGQPVSEPLRHRGAILVVRFSPEGDRVLTAGEDGTARLWPAPLPPAVAPPWLADLAETTAVLRGERTSGFRQNGVLTWEQLRSRWGKLAHNDEVQRWGE